MLIDWRLSLLEGHLPAAVVGLAGDSSCLGSPLVDRNWNHFVLDALFIEVSPQLIEVVAFVGGGGVHDEQFG